MSDTIYRQDAINILEGLSACEEYGVEVGTDEETYIGKYEAITAISDLPSADRPQGQWIDIGTFSHSYKCSVCGRMLFNITVGKNHVAKYYPYCHCGAKMKGVSNEGHNI